MPACPKSKPGTADGSAKHVQCIQQRHQDEVIDSDHFNAPISNLEMANVHWAITISSKNKPKVKPAEVYKEPNRNFIDVP